MARIIDEAGDVLETAAGPVARPRRPERRPTLADLAGTRGTAQVPVVSGTPSPPPRVPVGSRPVTPPNRGPVGTNTQTVTPTARPGGVGLDLTTGQVSLGGGRTPTAGTVPVSVGGQASVGTTMDFSPGYLYSRMMDPGVQMGAAMQGLDWAFKAFNTAVGGTIQVTGGAVLSPLGAILGETVLDNSDRSFFGDANPLYRDGFQLSDLWNSYRRTWETDLTVGQAVANVVGAGIRSAVPSEARAEAVAQDEGLTGLADDFDIYNQEQRTKAFGAGWGMWITGATDAAVQWFLAPDVLLGKGLGKAGKALYTETFRNGADVVKARQDLDLYRAWRNGEEGGKWTAMGELVDRTVPLNVSQMAQHDLALHSDNPGLVADMLGRVDNYDDAADVMLAMLGDIGSWGRLAERKRYLADQIVWAQRERVEIAEAMRGTIPLAEDEMARAGARIDYLDGVLREMAENDAVLGRALGMRGTDNVNEALLIRQVNVATVGRWQGVRTPEAQANRAVRREARKTGTAWIESHTAGSVWGRPVRVWQRATDRLGTPRSTGVVQFSDDVEYMAEIESILQDTPFLRRLASKKKIRAGFGSPSRDNDFMLRRTTRNGVEEIRVDEWRRQKLAQAAGAVTTEQRRRFTERLEEDLFEFMAAHYGYDGPDGLAAAKALYNKYVNLRQTAVNRFKEKKFIEDGGEIHLSDDMQSLLAESMPFMNFRFMDDVFRLDSGAGLGIAAYRTRDAAAGLLTNFDLLWRPLVLMRLGYTQRNVAEGWLRTLAVYGSLPALDSPAVSAGRFMSNRAAGVANKATYLRNRVTGMRSPRRIRRSLDKKQQDLVRSMSTEEALLKELADLEDLQKQVVERHRKAAAKRYARALEPAADETTERLTDVAYARATELADTADRYVFDVNDITPVRAVGFGRDEPLAFRRVAEAEGADDPADFNQLEWLTDEEADRSSELWDRFVQSLPEDAPSTMIPNSGEYAEFWELWQRAWVNYAASHADDGKVVVRVGTDETVQMVDPAAVTPEEILRGDVALVPRDQIPDIREANVYGNVLDLRRKPVLAPALRTERDVADLLTDEVTETSELLDNQLVNRWWRNSVGEGGVVDLRAAEEFRSDLMRFVNDTAEALGLPPGVDSQIKADNLSRLFALADHDPRVAEAISQQLWVSSLPDDMVQWMIDRKIIVKAKVAGMYRRSTKRLDEQVQATKRQVDEVQARIQTDEFYNDVDELLSDNGFYTFPVAGSTRIPDGQVLPVSESQYVVEADMPNPDRDFWTSNIMGPGFYSSEAPGVGGEYIFSKVLGEDEQDVADAVLYITRPSGGRSMGETNWYDLDEGTVGNREWLERWDSILDEIEEQSGITLDRMELDEIAQDRVRGWGIDGGNGGNAKAIDHLRALHEHLVFRDDFIEAVQRAYIMNELPDGFYAWEQVTAVEFWNMWSDILQARGFEGVTHTGGGRMGSAFRAMTGQAEDHQVYIWYNPPELIPVDKVDRELLTWVALQEKASKLRGERYLAEQGSVLTHGMKSSEIRLGGSRERLLMKYAAEHGYGKILLDDPATLEGYRALTLPSMTEINTYPVNDRLPQFIDDAAVEDDAVLDFLSVTPDMVRPEQADLIRRIQVSRPSKDDLVAAAMLAEAEGFTHIRAFNRKSGRPMPMAVADILDSKAGRKAVAEERNLDDLMQESLALDEDYATLRQRVQGLRADIAQATQMRVDDQARIDELKAALAAYRKRPTKRRMGEGKFNALGYQVDDAFADQQQGDLARALSSSGGTNDAQLSGYMDQLYRGLVRTRNKQMYQPGSDMYWDEFTTFVNRPLRNDLLAMSILQGKTDDEIVHALTRTKRGRAYVRDVIGRDADLNEVVAARRAETEALWSDPDLVEKILAGPITADDLRIGLAGRVDLPEVPGMEWVSQGGAMAGYRQVTSTIMKYLGTIPEDVAVRHPFYRRAWQNEMVRQVNIYHGQMPEGQVLTQGDLESMSRVAHRAALNNTRRTLYTITRMSTPAAALRFVVPFYAAWENTIKFWAKAAMKDPSIIARYAMLWNAPNESRLVEVVDADGNPIEPNRGFNRYTGLIFDPDQAFIRIPVPKGAADSLRRIGLDLGEMNSLNVAKGSLNMILQGEHPWMPSFGPIVVIPATMVAAQRPELEEIFKSVPGGEDLYRTLIPFGRVTDEKDVFEILQDQVMPAGAQKFITALRGEGDQQFVSTANEIYRAMLTDWELAGGKQSGLPEPEYTEAISRARSFFIMRGMANLTLPAAPSFRSKYQFYIDEWRRLANEYSESGAGYSAAKEKFLELYPEFFRFSRSLSENPSGMAASQDAYQLFRENETLAAKIGAIGDGNGGYLSILTNWRADAFEYSQAVRAWQMNRQYVPGVSDAVLRGSADPVKAEEQSRIEAGWVKYRQMAARRDALLAERGLISMSQPGAEDIEEAFLFGKQALIEENPVWGRELDNYQAGKWMEPVRAMFTVLQDERFMRTHGQEPVWQTMREWATTRQTVVDELARRKAEGGSGSIDANSNADLSDQWTFMVGVWKQKDTRFADMYDRFLDQDKLEEIPGVETYVAQ